MNPSDRRSALAALEVARPSVARLEERWHPEDIAAGLIEGWTGVEGALQSLLGGSALTGQPLVKEARAYELIELDDAHALLDFLAVRERASNTDYRPTTGDIGAARDAFARLEALLAERPRRATEAMLGTATGVPQLDATGMMPAIQQEPAGSAARRLLRDRRVVALLSLLLLAGLAYALYDRFGNAQPRGLTRGRQAFAERRYEAARGEFAAVARQRPDMAEPHIYLGRIAREEGDAANAQRELETAVRLEPANPDALREMGSYGLATGNLVLAQRFYERAIRANASDRSAQGFYACTLVRMGNITQATQNFLRRAGNGPWVQCIRQVPGAAAALGLDTGAPAGNRQAPAP